MYTTTKTCDQYRYQGPEQQVRNLQDHLKAQFTFGWMAGPPYFRHGIVCNDAIDTPCRLNDLTPTMDPNGTDTRPCSWLLY